MPKSKGRSSRKPSAQAIPPESARPGRSWRRRLGWPLCVIGGVSFLLGNIGARTGIVFLPFDPHHVIAQFGGATVLVIGLLWATGGSQGKRRNR